MFPGADAIVMTAWTSVRNAVVQHSAKPVVVVHSPADAGDP